MNEYEYWVCDGCRLTYAVAYPQHTIYVQQRSERIYGTEIVTRPVEKLVVCGTCVAKYREGRP